MKYVISRYERMRDERGFLTNRIEPTQDMATFKTLQEAEARLPSFAMFQVIGITHAGFKVREAPDKTDPPAVEAAQT